MKFKFTDKCIEHIIHSNNGIKLNLKGYAIYTGNVSDLKTLSDIELDKVKCRATVETVSELTDNLYELNYIPTLEGTYVTNDKIQQMAFSFGKYEIEVNKSQTNKTNFNVLIIGELYQEYTTYHIDMHKSYLAATIEDVNLDETQSKKIVFNVTFTDKEVDKINTELCVVDVDFNEFVEKETMKDLTTVQMADNYTLTPDSRNNDFSEEINIIQFDSETGNTNVVQKPYNLVLQDKTNKVNVPWNVKPRVFVGVDNTNKNITKPHIQWSYGKLENNKFITNAVNLQYNTQKDFFALNQNTGNRNVQVDILPEDIDEENKRCIKNKVKRFNLFDYSLVSANNSFFKFDTHNSKYTDGAYSTFEFINKNNTLGTRHYPVENVGLYRSSNNSFSGNNNNNLLIESNNNSLGFCFGDSTLINANNNLFDYGAKEYDPGQIEPTYRNTVFHNNVMIGTDKLYSTDIKYQKVTASNITFIGNNTNSTYYVASAKNLPEFDKTNSLFANVTQIYNIEKNSSEEITSFDSSQVQMKLNYGAETKTFDTNFNLGHEALIGFNGLSVTRYPSNEYFYHTKEQIGYDKANKKYYFYYSHPDKPQINNNYSVVFGNYNAYDCLTGLSVKIFKDEPGNEEQNALTKYVNNGSVYSGVYSSYYDTTFSASANSAGLYKYYFNHSQDNNVSYNTLTSDEGDFSLNKIVVVGNGRIKTNNAIKGHSPAEYASVKTDYSNDCIRLNLFSVEKDSYQLVHNDCNDKDPDFLKTSIWHFPGMFAVRGNTPVTQKYAYTKTGGDNRLIASLNKYNLHNAIYTTQGLFVPLKRSSNDVYKLTFKSLNNLINENYKKVRYNFSNFNDIDRKLSNLPRTFVYSTSGITNNDSIRYEITIDDIISYFNKLNYTIPKHELGNNTSLYTFYVVNENTDHDLSFEAYRVLGQGKSRLTTTKVIEPGHCIKVEYMDDGSHGCGGVLNFEYNK